MKRNQVVKGDHIQIGIVANGYGHLVGIFQHYSVDPFTPVKKQLLLKLWFVTLNA